MPITILKLLLELVSLTAKYLHDKQLIEAGIAQEIIRNTNESKDKINIAKRAMDSADSVPIEQDKYNLDK